MIPVEQNDTQINKEDIATVATENSMTYIFGQPFVTAADHNYFIWLFACFASNISSMPALMSRPFECK